jgi:hypothetical protein
LALSNQIFKRRSLLRGREREHSLVIGASGKAVELRAVFKTNGNTFAARERDDFLHAFAMTAAGDNDAVERPASRKRFTNSVDAKKSRHSFVSALQRSLFLTLANPLD